MKSTLDFVQGVIQTEIWKTYKWTKFFLRPFLRTVDNGAMTTLYVATHPDIENNRIQGEYFVPSSIIPAPYCRPAISKMNPIAKDRNECQRLWELSERLTQTE